MVEKKTNNTNKQTHKKKPTTLSLSHLRKKFNYNIECMQWEEKEEEKRKEKEKKNAKRQMNIQSK